MIRLSTRSKGKWRVVITIGFPMVLLAVRLRVSPKICTVQMLISASSCGEPSLDLRDGIMQSQLDRRESTAILNSTTRYNTTAQAAEI